MSSASRDRTEVESALKDKGFRQTETDHHRFTYFTRDGKKTPVRTKTSDSHKVIDKGLAARMARQCRLSKQRFLDLVDCPLSRDQYEAMLADAGHI